jgi:hypothetical protein
MQPAPGYLPWWMEMELELSQAMPAGKTCS